MEKTLGALVGLDAFVANTLGNNPGALASYETARSVGRVRGRKAAAKPPEAVAPSAAA